MSSTHDARMRHETVLLRFHFARTGAPPPPAPPLLFYPLLRRQPPPGSGSAPATSPLRRPSRNGRRSGSVRRNPPMRAPAGESPRPFACTSRTDSCRDDPRAVLDRSEPPLREPSPLLLVHPAASLACSHDSDSSPTRLPLERGPQGQFAT